MMDKMFWEICDEDINDSKIIQDLEFAKHRIPRFDVNWYYSNNRSLLMNAVDNRREELVRYLLRVPGINVNHRSFGGNAVLHFCFQVSILKLLLGHRDLDVNIQNDWGETELYMACYCGRSKACVRELLLDARVDTSIRDEKGRTARDIALRKGYPRIAKIINNSRYTPLLRIPNSTLLHDIVRMIIEEYV